MSMTERKAAGGSILVQVTGLLAVAAAAVVGTVWWMNSRQAAGPSATSVVSSAPLTEPPVSAPPPESTPPPTPLPDDLAAQKPEAAPLDADAPPTLEDLISRVMPAVVTIQTPSSRGSGFFVTPDTLITNVHVVGTNQTVTNGL